MIRIPTALSLAMLLASCAQPAQRLRVAPFSTHAQPEAGLTKEQIAFLEDNCGPFGEPALDPEWPHAPTDLVVREGYALEHSSVDKIALWVCEHVEPGELTGTAPRRDRFRPDPLLEGRPRAELSDYRRSGFDRGHEAPAGNQTVSQTLKDETFFLSNMIPQTPSNNQQVWRELEDLTRSWVDDGVVPSAWILTGGFFYDPAEEDEETADGLVEFQFIGENQVSVPTHIYKIVLAPSPAEEDEGGFRAVAFVLENRGYPRPFRFEDHIRSIRWIEERTRIDFFPDLVDPLLAESLEGSEGELWGAEP